jgi:hypothetical protein
MKSRFVEFLALAIIVAASAFGGAYLAHPKTPVTAVPSIASLSPGYNPPRSIPPLNPLEEKDPREPESRAVAERAEAMRLDLERLKAAADSHGGWDAWQSLTLTCREALKARVSGLRRFPMRNDQVDSPESQTEPLAALDPDFPLFQTGAAAYASYLYDGAAFDRFRKELAPAALRRWLAAKNIDLIFLPVPKMADVYIEHFVQPCPPDGVVNPAARRAIADLLQSDVETIDAWRLLRAQRDSDAEYLYNTADTHWAPRGMRVVAKAVADRIERYRFGARARYGLPIFHANPAAYILSDHIGGIGPSLTWDSLSAEQQRRAEALQTTTRVDVVMRNSRPIADNPDSPVLLLGHSFIQNFKDDLARECNLLLRTHQSIGAGGTPVVLFDLLREPEWLQSCRVVVWVTTLQHMTDFKPLPKAMR